MFPALIPSALTIRRAVVAFGLVLTLAACGDSDSDAEAGATADPAPAAEGEVEVAPEPTYDGLPTDLTSDEVCALLDEESIAEMLELETEVTPSDGLGLDQPDCQWTYRVPAGPTTNLHLQVMSMDQTDERLGREALDWALGNAPPDATITEIDALTVPNGSYEFGSSTVVLAVDPVGRLFTVSTHSDSPDSGRVAVAQAVLAALTEDHA